MVCSGNMDGTNVFSVLSMNHLSKCFPSLTSVQLPIKHFSQSGSYCNELDHDSTGILQTGFKTVLSLQQESKQVSLYFCTSYYYLTTM